MNYMFRAVLLCILALASAAPLARATPEETTGRILDALDTSGPFVFATQGNAGSLSVWWAGAAFVVNADNQPVTDASTFIDENGRLCVEGSFDASGVPAFLIVIDYPLEAPWLVFDITRQGVATLRISPDNQLNVCYTEKCKCFGPGTTVVKENCSDADCNGLEVCKKTEQTETAFCQWRASSTFCELRPELPIQEDDEFIP